MKQCVSANQLAELTNQQQINVSALFGEYGNCCNVGGETINIGKLSDRITIGKMIEVLMKSYNDYELANILEDQVKFIREDYDMKFEICDTLWESIKEML